MGGGLWPKEITFYIGSSDIFGVTVFIIFNVYNLQYSVGEQTLAMSNQKCMEMKLKG